MFDIGWPEMAVVAVIALIIIGPKDLPRIMRFVGQWAGKARGMARQFQRSIDDMARESDLDEVKKSVASVSKFNPAKELSNSIDPTGSVKQALDPTATDDDGDTSAKAAEETPAGEVKETPAETATEVPATASAETPAETPAEAPAETPAEAPAVTPAEAPAETPAEAPAETPAEAPAETPAEAPAETPAEAPAETASGVDDGAAETSGSQARA